MPYTILHTIETAGPGGAETVVLQLATRLDPARFRSLVLLPHRDWLYDKLREKNVAVELADGHGWWDPRLPRAMARLVRRENVSLIHSHLPDQNFYSALVGKLTGRKTLATYHGPVELAGARRLRQAVKLAVVKRAATRVVTVCDHVREMLLALGFPAEKLVRIYNGVPSAALEAAGGGRLRQELGMRNGAPLVGMVANVRASKGYEYFLRAARQVADRFPDARFVAVGDLHPELSAPLVSLAGELGLEDRLRFLGFREDVPAILADLDVFVLSSTSEGFPLVTLEAMAAARPVVATRCGGPAEVVDDGRTGFLVPVADADALAERIARMLADASGRRAMGDAGREKVREQFTLERMIENYERLYEELLGR